MLKAGSKAGIVCCSNARKKKHGAEIKYLEKTLLSMGLLPVFSDYIYERDDLSGGTARERAQALMDFYRDDSVKVIFDISGGDIANGILPYLDYDLIAGSGKSFWGYSDLTTVINAIYAKTGKASVLYQVRNLIYDHREQQSLDFKRTVLENKDDLFHIDYEFIRQDKVYALKKMSGIVVGGNIRCFLKLAGTEFMPDLQDKILLLEGYHGTVPQMETYLCQLEQLGAFRKAAGILLGTFIQMEEENCKPDMRTLIQEFTGGRIPVAVTKNIGHGTDAKGIVIGKEKNFLDNYSLQV